MGVATSLAAIQSSVYGRVVTIAKILQEKPAFFECMKKSAE